MTRHRISNIELKRRDSILFGGWHDEDFNWCYANRHGKLKCKLMRGRNSAQQKFGYWFIKKYLKKH